MLNADATMQEMAANPSAYFEEPGDIVRMQRLSLQRKLELLETWRAQVKRLAQSEIGKLTGGRCRRLADINLAIIELNTQLIARNADN